MHGSHTNKSGPELGGWWKPRKSQEREVVGCDAVKKGIILFGSQEILRSRIIYIYRILYDKKLLRPPRKFFVL